MYWGLHIMLVIHSNKGGWKVADHYGLIFSDHVTCVVIFYQYHWMTFHGYDQSNGVRRHLYIHGGTQIVETMDTPRVCVRDHEWIDVHLILPQSHSSVTE